MAITSSTAVNAAVAQARTLPQLVTTLQTIDPTLAASLESKPLIASKTPWGTLAVSAVAWASTKYGLGWDDTTCALIGGAGVVLGSYLMRYVSPAYVRGLFKTPSVPPSTPDVVSTNTAAGGQPPAGT